MQAASSNRLPDRHSSGEEIGITVGQSPRAAAPLRRMMVWTVGCVNQDGCCSLVNSRISKTFPHTPSVPTTNRAGNGVGDGVESDDTT